MGFLSNEQSSVYMMFSDHLDPGHLTRMSCAGPLAVAERCRQQWLVEPSIEG